METLFLILFFITLTNSLNAADKMQKVTATLIPDHLGKMTWGLDIFRTGNLWVTNMVL